MKRGMTVANDEVTLPPGVVAQPLLLDKSRSSALRLCRRYPLGLFKERDLLDAYRALVSAIEQRLETKLTRKNRNEQQPIYWSNMMQNRYELDAYESSIELGAIIFESLDVFREKNIDIKVCHRSRLDEATHNPVVDRWLEFIDLDIAPTSYRCNWAVAGTLILPVCVCLNSYDMLSVVLPPVGVLKLLPLDRGGNEMFETCPARLKGLIERKLLQTQYTYLVSDLVTLPVLKSGNWRPSAVDHLVSRHRPAFRAKGMDIFFCKLFCLRSLDRLFQWIEFVDLEETPNYTPQYVYEPFIAPKGAKVKVDAYSGEEYVSNVLLNKLKVSGNLKRGRLSCVSKPPPVFWFDDRDV